MKGISRRDLALLLLAAAPRGKQPEPIGGITRLQKLLFLLEQEENIVPLDGFDFQAYKAGPYSARLYDDLEFLENLNLIRSSVAGRATEQEAAEIDLSFEDLISPADELDRNPDQRLGTSDEYEERKYSLTDKGRDKVRALMANKKYQETADAVSRIKAKYGHYSLSDLLYYVYITYPNSATESEIRDKVLRRRYRQ